MGAPPPQRTTPKPEISPAPPEDPVTTTCSETEGVECGYVYRHSPVPSARFSILIYISQIPCPIQILFQICYLMNVYPQVSTLLDAW
jgi:hypothetical protein